MPSRSPASSPDPDEATHLDTLHGVLDALAELRASCIAAEHEFADLVAAVRPHHRPGAVNLVHYVAFRRHDLRALQRDLADLGLSSLGRCEPHVLSSIDQVITVVKILAGLRPAPLSHGRVVASNALRENADVLLGMLAGGRATRIMVTLPSEAAEDAALIAAMMGAGMDVARINCAHDGPDAWRAMAAHVVEAAAVRGRPCRIAMDLAGPKLRTGSFDHGAPVVRVAPIRDERGVVVSGTRVRLHAEDRAPVRSVDVALPVRDAAWLAACSVGDAVKVIDSRQASRVLDVMEVDDDGVVVEVAKTTYFETGLVLELEGSEGSFTTHLGALPRRDPAIRLKVDDELVLIRPGSGLSAAPGPDGIARVTCTLPEVFDSAEVGHRVYFDDGKIGATVVAREPDEVRVRITEARPGGTRLRGGKGINLPDTSLAISALTDDDERALEVAVQLADMINVSFIRSPDDVRLVQERMLELGADELGLVLKIETVPGFDRLPEILLTAMRSDAIGVMIARGDLAVEAGFERMAEVQEEILWLCEAAAVPVIWATQVLDQMARTGRPSRAEITDAALSARAECIMLNKGPHIVTAMDTLKDVHRRMHEHQHKKQSLLRRLRAWDRMLDASPDR